jgi:hypothetical protein
MPSEGEAGTGLGRDATVGNDAAVEGGQQVEGEVIPSGQAGGVGDRELRVPPLPLAPVPEKILGSRLVMKGEEFQIKWVGVDEPTWKPASDCQAYANHILAWRRESTGSRAGMSVGGVGSLPLSQQLVASAARSGLAPPSNGAASCSIGTAAEVAPNQRGDDSGGGGGGGDEQPALAAAAPATTTAAAGDIDQDAATASIGDAASTAHPDTGPPAATANPDDDTVPLGLPASDGGSSDSLGSEQQRQPEATATGISGSQEPQPGAEAGSVERGGVPSTLPSGEALASTEKLPGGVTGGDDQQGDDTTARDSTDGGVAAADSVCQEVPQARAPPERKWECAQCGRSWTKHRAYTGHLRYCLEKYPRSSRDLVNECPVCVPGSGKLRGHLGRHLTRSRDQVKPDKQPPPPPQPSAEDMSNKRSAEEGEGDDDGSLPTRRRSSRRMTSATEEGPGGQAAAVKEEVEKAGSADTSEGSTRRSKRASAGMAPKTLLQEAADAREVAAVTEAEKAAAAADAEAAAESEATEAAAAAQAKGKLKVVPTRRVGRGKAVRDPTCHDSHTLFRMHLHRQCRVWAVSWTYEPSCSALSGHTTFGRGEIRRRIN